MNCKICSHNSKKIFSAKIMKKYHIDYFFCWNCNFLSTEEPYWLKEVYTSPISKFDTGCIQRNINISKNLIILLSIFFDYKKKFVDYAGGHGLLVRIMRDIGFDFFWIDKYAENIFSSGFEGDCIPKSEVEAVTVFECFEHFQNPMEEIEKITSISNNVIFSTKLLPSPIPSPEDWWYYMLSRGGHISFYSKKTIQFIAVKFNLKYFSYGDLHILTKKKNINDFKLKILKLEKVGLSKVLSLKLKSKTLVDFENIKNKFDKDK